MKSHGIEIFSCVIKTSFFDVKYPKDIEKDIDRVFQQTVV